MEKIGILSYIGAWLLMPVLAIRHKILRVDYYEIRTELLGKLTEQNYIDAVAAYNALLDTDRYGSYIQLWEFHKDGEGKVLQKVSW